MDREPHSARGAADLIRRATEADRRGDYARAATLAADAAVRDPQDGRGWRLLGLVQEKLGDVAAAFEAYDRALALAPDDAALVRDMARLAGLVGLPQLAEGFLRRALALDPGSLEIVNDLALACCGQSRFGEAIEVLRTAITAAPGSAMLWNTLGCVLFESGQAEPSLVFFDEAIRLQPAFHSAYFNRANARKALGRIDDALVDCDQAIALGPDSPAQAAMYRYARALLLLNAGQVGAGWDAYAVRTEPAWREHVAHRLPIPAWSADAPLAGRRLLVMGEQGLGDEVLFANVLPDLVREIGPEGRLLIAVEPRLAGLFRRSFPEARVLAYEAVRDGPRPVRHVPDLPPGGCDVWARMGDFLAVYRRQAHDFPDRKGGFLTADPTRIRHWQDVLAGLGPGPKVGVIWRSLAMDAQRSKFYPPLELWAPVFRTPGVAFVNLQVGDCADELRAIGEAHGVEVANLPGLDLKDDLDDLAALNCALDLVLGPATATTNVAAAVGAETWFLTTPDAWPRLGTGAFPWYPQARAFSGCQGYDWPAVMAAAAEALAARFPA